MNGKHYRDEKYITYIKLDAEGKPLWIKDARGNLVMQYVKREKREPPESPQSINFVEPVNYIPAYDIAGNLLFWHSMDGGDRWTLVDAAAQPLCTWDNRNAIQFFALRRPISVQLQNGDHAGPITVMLTQYGDKRK